MMDENGEWRRFYCEEVNSPRSQGPQTSLIEGFRRSHEVFKRSYDVFRRSLEVFRRTLEIFGRTLERFSGVHFR